MKLTTKYFTLRGKYLIKSFFWRQQKLSIKDIKKVKNINIVKVSKRIEIIQKTRLKNTEAEDNGRISKGKT